jgi:PleD family two-component response regulator
MKWTLSSNAECTMANLRVLLVESEPEEVVILQDVLREIEDERWLHEWAQIELLHAATWQEAESMLTSGNYPGSLPHVVLLNPDLGDSQGAQTFRRSQAAAADIPVILLVNASDLSMAMKLVREGAQDFLIQKQVDCAPLAHAVRNAVSRHRLLAAARAATLVDSLTGLPNRTSFLAQANRDHKLAERLGCRWMLVIGDPRHLTGSTEANGEQRRELELVDAADSLRSIAGPVDTLARIGPRRFAMTIFDSELETLEEAWMRIRAAAAERRIEVGVSIFDSQRPVTLEIMLEQAELDLVPTPKPAAPDTQRDSQRETPRIAGAA